ncbi:hypothetical protein Tco_1502144 [Tanacetum coccineum]
MSKTNYFGSLCHLLSRWRNKLSLTTQDFYMMMNEYDRRKQFGQFASMQVNVFNFFNNSPEYGQSHKSYAPTSKASLPTRSHATIRYKGKEIAKPITPPSESASEEDSDLEQAQRDKDMQTNLALIAKYFKKIYKPTNNNLRTSSKTRNKNVDTTSRKPKRVKDSTYHKEKMLLCKQAEKGVQLQASIMNWLTNNDEEIDNTRVGMHINSYSAKIPGGFLMPTSGTDAEPLEQVDQSDVECDDERVALANLIANLKLDVDENKKYPKQLKKANATFDSELTECKSILAKLVEL